MNDWKQQPEALAAAQRELPAYCLRQRWYPAKDAGTPNLSLETLVPLRESAALALWNVAVAGRGAFQLFIPLAVVPPVPEQGEHPPAIAILSDGSRLIDATASDAFIRSLYELMLGDLRAESSSLAASHAASGASMRSAIGPGAVIKRSNVEQSNTSIRVGDSILKVIRKIAAGVHPELEMARFLTEEAHFGATPALLGWINLGEKTLAIAQAFVPNQGDGWTCVRSHLQGAEPDADQARRWLTRLGARTAELHAALNVRHTSAAFCAEQTLRADWEREARELSNMAARACDALASSASTLDAESQRLADAFKEGLPELRRGLLQLLEDPPVWTKTRHHGDFHLGQVLVCGEDAVIVDFEGEPLRPLEERRAKHVPLRDVAGMLRSIEYASAMAERELPREGAAERREQAAERLRRWAADASQDFWSGYLERLKALSGETLDESTAHRIVQFFLMEKALYEVLYELANRPAWVAIPLQKVVALLAEAQRAAPSAQDE